MDISKLKIKVYPGKPGDQIVASVVLYHPDFGNISPGQFSIKQNDVDYDLKALFEEIKRIAALPDNQAADPAQEAAAPFVREPVINRPSPDLRVPGPFKYPLLPHHADEIRKSADQLLTQRKEVMRSKTPNHALVELRDADPHGPDYRLVVDLMQLLPSEITALGAVCSDYEVESRPEAEREGK